VHDKYEKYLAYELIQTLKIQKRFELNLGRLYQLIKSSQEEVHY